VHGNIIHKLDPKLIWRLKFLMKFKLPKAFVLVFMFRKVSNLKFKYASYYYGRDICGLNRLIMFC